MKERSSTVRQGVTVRHNPCQGNRHDPNLRFEEQVDIRITCCGTAMSLLGNLSLREAGAPSTRLAYQCPTCFRQVTVTDCVAYPSQETLDELDAIP